VVFKGLARAALVIAPAPRHEHSRETPDSVSAAGG
jgi:hypothetical protein